MSKSVLYSVLAVLLLPLALTGVSRPSGWDDDTHGRDATPDYARVFPASRVGRLDITITASDWAAVMADMASMAGAFGAQRVQAQPPQQQGAFAGFPQASAEATTACNARVLGDPCSFGTVTSGRCIQQGNTPTLACVPVQIMGGGNAGGGANAGGANAAAGNLARGNNGADDVDIFPRTPIYVPATLRFDGETFEKVGFRLKGNSSLSNAWRAGVEKLPFRLNMDVLENEFPEIRDQTFFGFPNISFTSNGTDTSFMRQHVVTSLFREAGVPAAYTAYMRVYLDRGEGPVYLGLYTATEVPDSPLLNRLFGSDDGNLYKPVGSGGRWTQFFELSFPKKTNEADEDWTDIQDAIATLNESRASAAAWRARLEARFDVNGFLRWLALNTIVGNFDAYGGLSAHNYYLYGSPRHRDRLFWMAWDHDLAMNGSTGLGGAGGGNAGPGNAGTTVDLFHAGINATWPLIRFMMDDPVYRAAYRRHAEELLATTFEPTRLVTRLRQDQALITPFIVGIDGEQAGRTFLTNPGQFGTSVDSLAAYVQSRAASVRAALETTR